MAIEKAAGRSALRAGHPSKLCYVYRQAERQIANISSIDMIEGIAFSHGGNESTVWKDGVARYEPQRPASFDSVSR
jgi:hypothetical protein